MSKQIMQAQLFADKTLLINTPCDISEGENNTTTLRITVPENFCGYSFVAHFLCPNNRTFMSPPLEKDGDGILYDLPSGLLTSEGRIYVQLEAYKEDAGKIVFRSTKNAQASFFVNDSIVSKVEAAEEVSFFAKAAATLSQIDETSKKLQEKADSGGFRGEKGEDGKIPQSELEKILQSEAASQNAFNNSLAALEKGQAALVLSAQSASSASQAVETSVQLIKSAQDALAAAEDAKINFESLTLAKLVRWS